MLRDKGGDHCITQEKLDMILKKLESLPTREELYKVVNEQQKDVLALLNLNKDKLDQVLATMKNSK